MKTNLRGLPFPLDLALLPAKIPPINMNSAFERWRKAVVHLECATNSEDIFARTKRLDEFRERYQKGEITQDQWLQGMLGGLRDIRFRGTALFIRNADRRFLVTARHVLWDELSAKRMVEEPKNALPQSLPDSMREEFLSPFKRDSLIQIFPIVFRVPILDELPITPPTLLTLLPASLTNLGSSPYSIAPYTFSDPELDLAIVSLNQRNYGFAEDLERQGCTPIASEEFADGPSAEAAEVFTVGFPGSIAVLAERPLKLEVGLWASGAVCLPTFAFGRVSMLHQKLDFFWCDMSIYPGNSGGPVIENNKLVGIVSAQPTIPIEGRGVSQATTRIPFAKVTKAKHIIPLLDEQIKKDKEATKLSTS